MRKKLVSGFEFDFSSFLSYFMKSRMEDGQNYHFFIFGGRNTILKFLDKKTALF